MGKIYTVFIIQKNGCCPKKWIISFRNNSNGFFLAKPALLRKVGEVECGIFMSGNI